MASHARARAKVERAQRLLGQLEDVLDGSPEGAAKHIEHEVTRAVHRLEMAVENTCGRRAIG